MLGVIVFVCLKFLADVFVQYKLHCNLKHDSSKMEPDQRKTIFCLFVCISPFTQTTDSYQNKLLTERHVPLLTPILLLSTDHMSKMWHNEACNTFYHGLPRFGDNFSQNPDSVVIAHVLKIHIINLRQR